MSKKRYRYRFDWFPFIQKQLRKYPNKMPDTLQGKIAEVAIEKSFDEIGKTFNGDLKQELIRLVYFSREQYPICNAADIIHVSERTAQRWSIEFVYLVADHMGYR